MIMTMTFRVDDDDVEALDAQCRTILRTMPGGEGPTLLDFTIKSPVTFLSATFVSEDDLMQDRDA
jgi:hypothetical protein